MTPSTHYLFSRLVKRWIKAATYQTLVSQKVANPYILLSYPQIHEPSLFLLGGVLTGLPSLTPSSDSVGGSDPPEAEAPRRSDVSAPVIPPKPAHMRLNALL